MATQCQFLLPCLLGPCLMLKYILLWVADIETYFSGYMHAILDELVSLVLLSMPFDIRNQV